MDIRFDNKTALVTGAGRGIGRALSEKLYQLGAKVIAVSKSQANLDDLKANCPNIITVSVDLFDWDDTIEKLKDLTQDVDYLVNNAATSECVQIGDITEQSVDSMFAINYKASLNLIQLVTEGMKKRKYGSIVNVSSVASMVACDGHTVYASTKCAMDMLTKIGALELGKYNIRVNSVNPTVVWTDMGKLFWSEETKKKAITAKIPMGRFVEVNEVVDPVLFLLTDHAGMISGALIPIDGGYSAA